eukprot:TRINITY_DN18094_c0_g1_i1.p1 TRINITY_DN18094_c0_g1~~TRINITY_DN18094_c0_g1_i1.p1  ORF type:complete len:100 (-),score=33.86 TRINITY_DN18094_c0_g1_i1:436-735(-)
MQCDYSPAKAANPAPEVWEDTHLFYLRNMNQPKRGAVAILEAEKNQRGARIEVNMALEDATMRVRRQRALDHEQRRRAFWHVKWTAPKADETAHKCMSP